MGLLSLRRKVSWLLLFEVARMGYGHLTEVTSPEDRRRVVDIVRRSKGRPQNITAGDKDELRRIAGQLELGRFLRAAGPRMMFGRGRRGH
ncbi:hypothetical protein [Capillimicrobium parvum]|uniref:Uncharacterized protein n=1 Tax=Capillimicrobium parvum TaxID=2884022 RepID=A0A9E6XZX8_9ACTN|nr:hypothetical protein [Capillimicrobium parvum]UGS37554.1 hypothetical protein DSM104329_03971 [Capillimicrobium parvum]